MSVPAKGRARDLAVLREQVAGDLLRALGDGDSVHLSRPFVAKLVRALVPEPLARHRPGGAFWARDTGVWLTFRALRRSGESATSAAEVCGELYKLDPDSVRRIVRQMDRTTPQ